MTKRAGLQSFILFVNVNINYKDPQWPRILVDNRIDSQNDLYLVLVCAVDEMMKQLDFSSLSD